MGTLQLEISSFADGKQIPGDFAFCIPDEQSIITLGPNRNPHLSWSGAPDNTRSFCLIVHDPDVPSVPDQVNQQGQSVPYDLPRIDFYHWVMVDIPASLSEIPEGADSDRVIARGKELGATDYGLRGRNDYTAWFAGDADMEGIYAGYDGPCPPWNDERLHHYIFRLYALDVETTGLAGNFGGQEALQTIEGHILDQSEWAGLYTFKPELYPRD